MESTDTKVLCLVCAEAIPDEADKAMCGRCKTPYHLKCWNYAGKCSVYACSNVGTPRDPVIAKEAKAPTINLNNDGADLIQPTRPRLSLTTIIGILILIASFIYLGPART